MDNDLSGDVMIRLATLRTSKLPAKNWLQCGRVLAQTAILSENAAVVARQLAHAWHELSEADDVVSLEVVHPFRDPAAPNAMSLATRTTVRMGGDTIAAVLVGYTLELTERMRPLEKKQACGFTAK